jgi:hypothetical protein
VRGALATAGASSDPELAEGERVVNLAVFRGFVFSCFRDYTFPAFLALLLFSLLDFPARPEFIEGLSLLPFALCTTCLAVAR